MTEINRKAYLDSKHRLTIKYEEIPKPGNLDVVVKVEANGICGSDIHFYKEGKLGNFIVNQPYVPGHECSGTVVKTGTKVDSLSVGDIVTIEPGIPCGRCSFCRSGRYNLCMKVEFLSAPPVNGTFCDYICVPADMVYQIPKKISFEEAAMIEPTAVAVHAVNRARFRKGASAAIVGAGPIGLLTLQAFKASGGGEAICIDINDYRLKIAKKLGADYIINPDSPNSSLSSSDSDSEKIMDSNSKKYLLSNIAEVVFETAGSDRATALLFGYATPGGCVVQVGWPRSNQISMNIAQFIEKEIDYVGVNRYANAYPAAISWVCDRRINVKDLITHRFSFDKIEEAFVFTGENPSEVIKTMVLNS